MPTLRGMDLFAALARLLARNPLIFAHLVCALGALALGAVILVRRKGTASHRATGWAWVLLMGSTMLTSAFIRDYRMPNVAGITPIHFFTAMVAVQLPRAVLAARRGDIALHRKEMRGLYTGGCVVAGLFTLLPGRFLGRQFWAAVGPLFG
jgi:uncharacterized membrane protein